MLKRLAQPFAITLVLGIIAAFALWTQEGWLAPSVAAAAFLQVFSPDQPAARPYSIAVGQIIGGIAGFIGVLVMSAGTAPLFSGAHHLTDGRFWAVLIAVAIASTGQTIAKAPNPAGGATAVVVAMGAETATWAAAGRLLIGILLVTTLGEIARQAMLRLESAQSAG